MKRIIVSLFVSLSLLVSAPVKADSGLALIDLTYAVGRLVVLSAAAGVMLVAGTAIKATTPSKTTENIVEAPTQSVEAPGQPSEPTISNKVGEQEPETPSSAL